MVKKIVIAGLFLGGGYYFIKKILPNFTKKEFQADTMSIEERLAEEERKARELADKVRKTLISKYGTADPNKLKDIKTYMFAPDINFDKLQEGVKQKLAEQFGVDEFWNPNNLSSYQGLKGWQPNF